MKKKTCIKCGRTKGFSARQYCQPCWRKHFAPLKKCSECSERKRLERNGLCPKCKRRRHVHGNTGGPGLCTRCKTWVDVTNLHNGMCMPCADHVSAFHTFDDEYANGLNNPEKERRIKRYVEMAEQELPLEVE